MAIVPYSVDSAMSVLKKFDMQQTLAIFKHEDIENERHPFRCKVAAAYGNLTSESVKSMDAALKVGISATLRSFKKAKDDCWPTVLACMMNNPLLEPEQACHVTSRDAYTIKKKQWYKCGPDPVIINEVEFWFKKLINDDDIITDLRIDKEFMAKIVAETGAKIDGVLALLSKTEYAERTVLDAGILRYPDLDHPYFKLYKLQIKAWRHCKRVIARQKDRNGITGDFKCMQFKPRDDVIAEIRPELIETAAAEAEKLLREEIGI